MAYDAHRTVPIVGTPPKKDARFWTEWNLENWARILSTGGRPDGHAKQVLVGENYTSLDLDGDASYEALCYRLADITSIIIIGLPEPERLAIRHRFLGESFDFWTTDKPYGVALAAAIPLVTEGLRRRGVYLGN